MFSIWSLLGGAPAQAKFSGDLCQASGPLGGSSSALWLVAFGTRLGPSGGHYDASRGQLPSCLVYDCLIEAISKSRVAATYARIGAT